jgi:hypothetical protein
MNENLDKNQQSKEIKNFFSKYNSINRLISDMELHLESNYAPRFTVFDYIPKNELSLSHIIASLLDPTGAHGQNELFLFHFIQLIKLNLSFIPNIKQKSQFIFNDLKSTVVKEEVNIYNVNNKSRIDILCVGTNFVIGIENKPYASESENQISGYQKLISEKYKNYPTKIIIFLSGNNLVAQSADETITDVPVLLMGYCRSEANDKDVYLSDWIETSIKHCKIDKIRNFLSDFLSFIDIFKSNY